MRLNKLLASRLKISRRKADAIIASGRVTIDGRPAKQGLEIDNEDLVTVDGKNLPQKLENTYLLLNKPAGYICSRTGQGGSIIYELLPKRYWHLNPVGRLDKDSSGLLLMTNDGDLHNKLTHPSFKKEKVYLAALDKVLDNSDKKMIETGGVTLADGISKFEIKNSNGQLEIRMHEGRNRQIRRTFEALGYKVTALNRTQFGNYNLGDLGIGNYKIID
jgi:pseudouridine synthase